MEYSDQTLYISDLATVEGANYVIQGETFTNCIMRGPSVVMLSQSSASSGEVTIPDRDPSTVVIVAEEDRKALPVGVVLIRDCQFEACTFESISFFATAPEATVMKQTFMSNVPVAE